MSIQQVIRSSAAVMAALWLLAGTVHAANVVYMSNDKIVAQTVAWRESAQEYRVTANDVIQMIPKTRVERLEIDKPADFDKAEQMLKAGKGIDAIPMLEAMITQYKMCIWDNRARELMSRIYSQSKDYKKAVSILEEIFKNLQPWENYNIVRRFYWDMLRLSKTNATLNKELTQAIETGSREVAALAYIMRGDMKNDEGQKEQAVLDYLRVALMFEDVKAAQPEALFKTAELLDALRDPRANQFKKKLVQKYPDSEYRRKVGDAL